MKKLTKFLEKNVFIPNNQLTNYDIAIVFGGPDMIPTRINEAIKLYKQNKISKILVTGGIGYFNKDKTNTEANIMKEYLLKNKIPTKDILIENKSRNTKENIIYSVNLLKEKYDLSKTTILLISSDYHIKRCKLLFSNYLNNISIYGTSSKINKNNWSNSFYGYFTIIKEYILLKISMKKRLPK